MDKKKATDKKSHPDVLPDVAIAEIDRSIQTALFHKTFSGAACIASVGGNIFHRGVYGCLKQPPPLQKVGHETLFDLASLTKPLATGLAALIMSSKGRLDIGVDLLTALPELRDTRFRDVAVDMLLDHTAGFPAFKDYWKMIEEQTANQKTLGTANALPLMKKLISETSFEYSPGTKTIYSDIGFMVLAWIIESASELPLDVYLERTIYRDLGIDNNLFFLRNDDLKKRKLIQRRQFVATEDCPWRKKFLQSDVHDRNAWAIGGVAGHAGLFGTADAVWKLCYALLEGYHGRSPYFLSGGVRKFWTRSKRHANSTRALAWDTPSAQGSMAGLRFSRGSVGHLGYTGTSIWIDLSNDVIGVVLTNSVHPGPDNKPDAMKKFRPHIYELISKYGESLGVLEKSGPNP